MYDTFLCVILYSFGGRAERVCVAVKAFSLVIPDVKHLNIAASPIFVSTLLQSSSPGARGERS
jgi:hypothetical protein